MKKKLLVLSLMMLFAIPLSVMADEWTVGSWDIWNHRAVNASYQLGWNDTAGSLLFRLYPDANPPYSQGLVLFEIFLPREKIVNHVSAYKELKDEPILDMLKNYSIIATQFDRQYQNGSGTHEDAWYVNAYIYVWENHTTRNENASYFALHRIWNDTTNSPKYWQPLPQSMPQDSSKFALARASSGSVICKYAFGGIDWPVVVVVGIGIGAFIFVLVVLWSRKR